jgi:hypothetical protein
MKKMGRYCRAYPIARLRQFDGWAENLQNLRKEVKLIDGREVELTRALGDEDFIFLHEDFTVTDGIFIDENIIYNTVSPEWVSFCKKVLEFEAPNDVLTKINGTNESNSQDYPPLNNSLTQALPT